MKHKKGFLNFLFHPRGQIIFCLLLFSAIAIAQETPPEEFPVGAILGLKTEPAYYDSFALTGMNMMMHYTTDETEQYSLLANNGGPTAWIAHYSSAFYSKWEAEENQLVTNKVGVKHKFGSFANFDGRDCWSTEDLSEPADSLVYGPHYHQEKLYKRWYGAGFPREVKYTPRYSMALTYNQGSVAQSEKVCVIKVVYRYGETVGVNTTTKDSTLRKDTLIVSDFNSDSSFKDIYLQLGKISSYKSLNPNVKQITLIISNEFSKHQH